MLIDLLWQSRKLHGLNYLETNVINTYLCVIVLKLWLFVEFEKELVRTRFWEEIHTKISAIQLYPLLHPVYHQILMQATGV